MCIRHDYVQRPKIGMCAWMAGWLLCFTSFFATYVFCTCLKVNVFRVYFIYFTFKSTVKYYVRLVFDAGWCWCCYHCSSMWYIVCELILFSNEQKALNILDIIAATKRKNYIGFVCCIQNEIASRLTIKYFTDKSSFNATASQKEKEIKYQRTKRYEIFSQIWSTLQRVLPSILALHRFLSHLSH